MKTHENVVYPSVLYSDLDKLLIGQKEAKKALTTAFASHITGTRQGMFEKPAPRILMFGSTGCGKTHMLEKLKELNPELHFIFVNSSQYTGEGWSGESLSEILDGKKSKFKKVICKELEKYNVINNLTDREYAAIGAEVARRVVIVFDEFDKISYNRNNDGTAGSGHKKSLQDDMLKLVEGQDVSIVNDKGVEFVTISSRVIPMIFLGAFDGLDLPETRETKASFGFFGTEEKPKEESIKDIIHKYGFLRELCGRITTVARLNKLTEEEMIQILDVNVFGEFVKEFSMYGVAILFTPTFRKQVATLSIKSNEGARALKSIVEEQLRDLLFEIEKHKYDCVTIEEVGNTSATYKTMHSISDLVNKYENSK